MKKLLMVLCTGTLLYACNDSAKESAIAKNSDWYSDNLKGMVQTIETTDYTADSTGTIGEMDSCCASINQYDKNGYMLSNTQKDSKGTLSSEMTITRHEKGQAKTFRNMKSGVLSNGFDIQIDENGKYSGAQELDSAGKVAFYYTELTEDEDGKITSGKRYKADSTFSGTFYNEYKNGAQLVNRFTDSSGKEVNKTNYELNDKNEMVKSTNVNIKKDSNDKDSTVTTVTSFTYDSYDETGNWTQRTAKDADGKVTKQTKRTYTYFTKE